MEHFIIEVVSKKPKKIYGLLSHTGKITIGNFKENFVMPLDSWTLDEYKQQWQEGLARIKTHDVSCLVVTAQNITANSLVELWVLYKKGDTIFFQNKLLTRSIMQVLNLPLPLSEFNKENCYLFITPRRILTDDGEKISEWSIAAEAVLNKVIP